MTFTKVCEVDYTVNGNVLQVEIPRSALGLTDETIRFNFKWSDNLQGADAMSFYTNGDCAPGGRFTFVFDSTATEQTTEDEPQNTNTLWQKIVEKFAAFLAACRQFFNYLFR